MSNSSKPPLIDDGWWGDWLTIEILALIVAPLIVIAAPFVYAYWWWKNRE